MKKDQIKNVDDRKIIGVLSDKKVPVGISESLALHLEQKDRSYVCLPFVVEAEHLKNIVMCLKLMDIEGLVITGKHSKDIIKYLETDMSAKEAGMVNIVKRNGSKLIGSYLVEDNFIKNATEFFKEN